MNLESGIWNLESGIQVDMPVSAAEVGREKCKIVRPDIFLLACDRTIL